MQHIYIKESFRILMAEFKASLNDEFDSALTRRLIIFIVFILVLCATYIVIWFPLISKVSNDVIEFSCDFLLTLCRFGEQSQC